MSSRFGRNRLAVLATLVIVGVILAALLAPYLPPADPDTVDTPNRPRRPLTVGHFLGTDKFGRDLLDPRTYSR
jgi:peptide/nickel transport system permease protein